MAIAQWLYVDPTSGSGNKTVNVSSASPHTGRSARNTMLTVTAPGCESKTVQVNQAGKPAHVTNDSDTATAVKEGQNVTISGKSNVAALTFSLGTGNIPITLPTTYTAAGVTTNNGAAISGDPGATAEYAWSIVIAVPANTGTTTLTKQIIISDGQGNQDVCTITQAAGEAYLRVDKTALELDWEGNVETFNVESNTTWTIS